MHLGSLVAVIVYFLLYGASGYSAEGLRSALLTALLVKSGYMAIAWWYDEHKHFDFGIWIMFAVGAAAVLLEVDAVVGLYRVYSPAILFTTLGLTAIVPTLLGRASFVEYFARRSVPRWQQKTPEFRAINSVMTVYWALIFFAAAALCAYAPLDPRFTFVFPNLLIFGPGITAQWWLPRLYFRLFPPGLPQSIEPLIMAMPMVFDPAAARGAKARIQFHVSGADSGAWWVRISDGRCESFEGVTEAPDLTVRTPDTVWMKIARGQLDGARALADGLYQAQGDFTILAKMSSWFVAAR
ncbi:MAG: SCP2 sterol-binding domain-containing protein [Candidatus Binatia bacterium]